MQMLIKLYDMKQFVVVLFFGLGIMTVSGQNFSELRSVDLSGPEQYEKVEDVVLDCCYYLTGTPNEKKNTTRDDALEFVLRITSYNVCYTKLLRLTLISTISLYTSSKRFFHLFLCSLLP